MGETEKAKKLEQRITEVLTTTGTSTIKRMIEKDHAIDCLFLLVMDKGKWKKAKSYMNKQKLTLSDGTYRARMIEITQLGLAKATPIDPLKKQYSITKKGKTLALALLDLLQNM